MKSTYRVMVMFERSGDEDPEVVANKYGDAALAAKLGAQLRDELQEACDHGMIAGRFTILSIEDPESDDWQGVGLTSLPRNAA